MPALRLGDRLQYLIVRLLSRLPDAAKIRLSGEPAIVIDGQQLDPQSQLLRSLVRRRHTFGLVEPTVAAGRWRYRRQAEIFRGPITPVGSVRDFDIPGPAGPLRVRFYSPQRTEHLARPSTEHLAPQRTEHLAPQSTEHQHPHRAPSTQHAAPLVVYFHGGGFVIGDLDTHDEPCRILCHHAGTHVLSVDYRLAPEHPFPAAVDDALAAFAWAHANASSLGADPFRVAIGGDSAGANLAAVVSIARPQGATPFAQLLIYPATDGVTERKSWQLFREGFVLTMRDREAFFRYYGGETPPSLTDPRISPLYAHSLAGAAPALVAIAGFDPLRDEGDAYATALQAAGTPVQTLRFPSLEHGFIHLTGISAAARRAMRDLAWTFCEVLAREIPERTPARQ